MPGLASQHGYRYDMVPNEVVGYGHMALTCGQCTVLDAAGCNALVYLARHLSHIDSSWCSW